MCDTKRIYLICGTWHVSNKDKKKPIGRSSIKRFVVVLMSESPFDNGNITYFISAVSIKWNMQFVLRTGGKWMSRVCRISAHVKENLWHLIISTYFFSSGHWCPVARKLNPTTSMLYLYQYQWQPKRLLYRVTKRKGCNVFGIVLTMWFTFHFFSLRYSYHPSKSIYRHTWCIFVN